tara:strand:- start:263 stop:868 length:606 start_codon:yes stop_codon:yes gene_type:complete
MARLRTHTNPLNIRHRFEKDWINSINKTSFLDIEIGCGRGVFLRDWAKQNLNRTIVGIEVRKSIVDILQDRIKNDDLPNATIIHGNGHYFLQDGVENNTIDRLFIFHPDPWFKKRHHKRRVINHEFLNIAAKKLKPEGKLCISTDVKELWEEIQSNLKNANFKEVKDEYFWENQYNTHWHTFSEKENRSLYFESFSVKNFR